MIPRAFVVSVVLCLALVMESCSGRHSRTDPEKELARVHAAISRLRPDYYTGTLAEARMSLLAQAQVYHTARNKEIMNGGLLITYARLHVLETIATNTQSAEEYLTRLHAISEPSIAAEQTSENCFGVVDRTDRLHNNGVLPRYRQQK